MSNAQQLWPFLFKAHLERGLISWFLSIVTKELMLVLALPFEPSEGKDPKSRFNNQNIALVASLFSFFMLHIMLHIKLYVNFRLKYATVDKMLITSSLDGLLPKNNFRFLAFFDFFNSKHWFTQGSRVGIILSTD